MMVTNGGCSGPCLLFQDFGRLRQEECGLGILGLKSGTPQANNKH